ncbi:ParA family protein [Halolamina sp.]|uniref:ParA family protein n=1 Tax=Halolamina sp. TaxID=1940283 RepID=UPI00356A779E
MGGAVSVSLQKGGVGKTTIAINLADALAADDDVLLVDLDQQGNATEGVGLKDEYETDGPHIGDVLTDDDPVDVQEVIIEDLENSPFAEYLPAFGRSEEFDTSGSPGPGIRHRIAFSRAWHEGKTLREYDSENDMLERLDQLADLVKADA